MWDIPTAERQEGGPVGATSRGAARGAGAWCLWAGAAAAAGSESCPLKPSRPLANLGCLFRGIKGRGQKYRSKLRMDGSLHPVDSDSE
jgi:hypothetical protein